MKRALTGVAGMAVVACAHGGLRTEANRACANDLYKGGYAKSFNIGAEWCETMDDEHIGYAKRLVDDNFMVSFKSAYVSVEGASASEVACARAEYVKHGGTFRIPKSCR